MATALLTPRDREILLALDRCPLTARQLLRLSKAFSSPFTSERKLRARMQVMAESGRVFRWHLAIAGRGCPTCYSLTRYGHRLVHGSKATPPGRRAFRPVGIAHQDHTFALAEFIVHTAIAAAQGGIGLTEFSRENMLALVVDNERRYPDSAFTLVQPEGGRFRYFVELDNGSERIRSDKETESLTQKIRFYEALQDRSAERFRVLFVGTRSQDRIGHILDLARDLARNPHRSLVYAINLAAYLAEPDALCAPCFLDHRGSAVSLLPAYSPIVPRLDLPVRETRHCSIPMVLSAPAESALQEA